MLYLLASGGLLDVDTGLFWWVLVTFLLFIFILSKFAWKPILSALDERESNIQKSLDSAKEAMAKAEEIAAKNDEALRQAEVLAQQIRKEAKEQAEARREELIEKAKEESQKILDDAKATIEREKKAALEQLRAEVSSLAIQAASQILDAELDEAKNKKLVDNFLSQLN